MDNLATTGQVVPPGHVQKVGIYIHLLSSEWEEYRRCYSHEWVRHVLQIF